jgi:hypothetical protein
MVKKVDKYLTDLKELPLELKVEESEIKPKVQEVAEIKKAFVKEVSSGKTMGITSLKSEATVIPEDYETVEEIIDKPYTSRDIILGVINLLSIIFLVFLLIKLPQKAEELKELRIEDLKDSQNLNVVSPTFESDKKKSTDLQKLFLDDFGVVNFTVDIEKLKTLNPAIQKVTFTSQKPIKDRLGFLGLPVVIILEGDWNTIGQAMNSLEALPYLFRPVSIKSDIKKDDPNVIVLNYGGLLYVGD